MSQLKCYSYLVCITEAIVNKTYVKASGSKKSSIGSLESCFCALKKRVTLGGYCSKEVNC